jgi:hypothetical protein
MALVPSRGSSRIDATWKGETKLTEAEIRKLQERKLQNLRQPLEADLEMTVLHRTFPESEYEFTEVLAALAASSERFYVNRFEDAVEVEILRGDVERFYSALKEFELRQRQS